MRHVMLFLLVISLLSGSSEARADLTTALALRSLTAEQAREKTPVSLQGTIIFIDSPGTAFMQDETAGAHIHMKPGRSDLRIGDRIKVEGVTMPGLFLPGVDVSNLEIIGRGALPAAIPASHNDLTTGRFHYQRVSVEGIGRTLAPLDENRSLLRLATGGRVIEVRVDALPESAPGLVDARLRVTALAAGGINDRRQLVFPYLRVTDWSNVAIVSPARPENEVPLISVTNLLRFTGKPDEAAQSVRVQGIVLAAFPDGRVFARDQTPPPSDVSSQDTAPVSAAVSIRLDLQYQLNPGDAFDAAGFPIMEGFTASLADARLLSVESGPAPKPLIVATSAFMDGTHDADLVMLDRPVTLLDHFRTADGYELRLNAYGTAIRAFMPRDFFVGSISSHLPSDLPSASIDSDGNLTLQKGATLGVTGICLVESSSDKGFRSFPDRASLLLRGPHDVVVINAAPFWNMRRLIIAVSTLGGIVLLSLVWIAALRRRVTSLQARIVHQATLDERQRIAREFHDTLEQELAGLSLRMDAAATRQMDEKARALLKTSRSLVSRVQAEARNLVADLRDEPGENVSLVSALQALAQRQPPNAPAVHVELEGSPPALPPHITHHLRMIAQEALTNALKHAQARHITLRLGTSGGIVTLTIADDGPGLDPSITEGKPGHFGCMGIRERCRKINANVEWQTQPGHGTTVSVTLPL